MNKRQKETAQAQLKAEKAVLSELEQQYQAALHDIEWKIRLLETDDMTQSQIYRVEYQKTLKKQVEATLEMLHSQEYNTIKQFLSDTYINGFVGTMYDLHGQGFPLLIPIDKVAAAKAIVSDTKLSEALYDALGLDIKQMKKAISAEITRGIASGQTHTEIARNINFYSGAPLSRAKTIARTESHRIQQASTYDAQTAAKAKGADIVKQWDSTLDGDTRPNHRHLDGQIREIDEPFTIGGLKAMFPGDFGDPAEDCNCRCSSLQRARKALDADELATLEKRAAVFGLDKSESLEDFKSKYMKAVEESQAAPKAVTIEALNSQGTKMLSDLYERHRTSNGLKSVPYGDLGEMADNVVSANYGNMSAESAKVFQDALSELAEEYDTPLQKIRTMQKNEFLGNKDSFAFVRHDYTVDSAELVINQAKCKNIEELSNRLMELSKKGYCVKIPDEIAGKYVITHEFAHTLINLEQPLKNSTNWVGADYGKIRKARKEITSVYEGYMAEVETLTKAKKSAELLAMTEMTEESWTAATEAVAALNAVKLSDYSLESADEFLAEAFANEKIGVSSNPYSKAVIDIVNKYFKR